MANKVRESSSGRSRKRVEFALSSNQATLEFERNTH